MRPSFSWLLLVLRVPERQELRTFALAAAAGWKRALRQRTDHRDFLRG